MDQSSYLTRKDLKTKPKTSSALIALISLLSLEEDSAKSPTQTVYFAALFCNWVSTMLIKHQGCLSFEMLVLCWCCTEGEYSPLGKNVPAFPMQVRTWSQKVQNDYQVQRALTLRYVWVETLQTSLRELRLLRHVGILWKELKWQISQFPSFLAKINLTGWLVSLCLWMRAFELNALLLIRKRRLGDNDICWLWKEKTSNQHILTGKDFAFLAVLDFDFFLKLWTYTTMWKSIRGRSPAIRSPRHLRKASGWWLLLAESSACAGGHFAEKEGPDQQLNGRDASLREPSENVQRDTSDALTSGFG